VGLLQYNVGRNGGSRYIVQTGNDAHHRCRPWISDSVHFIRKVGHPQGACLVCRALTDDDLLVEPHTHHANRARCHVSCCWLSGSSRSFVWASYVNMIATFSRGFVVVVIKGLFSDNPWRLKISSCSPVGAMFYTASLPFGCGPNNQACLQALCL